MIAVYILVGPLVLLATGLVCQRFSETKDKHNYPPPGQLVDIGRHKLRLLVSGSGSPTVILEAVFSDYSIHWKEIKNRLEEKTLVVSYDRAGMGWSDASPYQREPS